MKRLERTKILVNCEKEFLKEWSDIFSKEDKPIMISEPENSLVMVKMRESAQNSLFYLCEVLVSQARVQINDKIGIGLIKGDDLDKAYYLAVIDAAYQNKKDLSAFDDALRKQQHLQQLKAKINVQNILKTKVSFETMDI